MVSFARTTQHCARHARSHGRVWSFRHTLRSVINCHKESGCQACWSTAAHIGMQVKVSDDKVLTSASTAENCPEMPHLRVHAEAAHGSGIVLCCQEVASATFLSVVSSGEGDAT